MKIRMIVWKIIASGKPADTNIDTIRKILILNALLLPGLLFSLTFGIHALIMGNTVLGMADISVFLFQLWLYLFMRNADNLEMPISLAVNALLLFFLVIASQGGTENSAVLWILLFPTAAVFLMGTRKGLTLSLVMLLGVLAVFSLGGKVFVQAIYTGTFKIRVIAVYSVVTLLAVIAEELRGRIHDNLVRSNKEKEQAIEKLNRSIEEIKTLQGIIPICLHCKKIRDDEGFWQAVEEYVQYRTEAQFSHALCPDCAKEFYPEFVEEPATYK